MCGRLGKRPEKSIRKVWYSIGMAEKKRKEKPKANLNEIDKDIGTIAICAVRYALGRETYVPGIVQDFVRRHPEIVDANAKAVMIRDIDDADKITEYSLVTGEKMRVDGLGDTTIDRPGWERFREWLRGLER